MTYFVVVTQKAKDDLRHYYSVAAGHAPETAARWLNRFEQALQSLSTDPTRCPLAPRMTSLTNPCINSSTENAPDDTELSLPSRMIVFLCSTFDAELWTKRPKAICSRSGGAHSNKRE